MSFSVIVSPDFVKVDPGTTVPLSIEILNERKQADHYELQVEGLDYDWLATPVPSLTVEAGQRYIDKILLKPPRASESLVGTYPFVVKIRSLQSGETRSAQGILEIKPFYHVSIDIAPRRGVLSPLKREFAHTVTLINLGNTEISLQMFANDPEEACAFEFEQDKVILGAGQQKTVNLVVCGTRRPWLANSRLFGFSVVARSFDTANVVATAQAQVEQRAFASPAAFLVGLILLVLLLGWFAMIPKPPTVDRFYIDKQEIVLGEPIQIEWAASNARSVQILNGGSVLYNNLALSGSKTFCPSKPGEYEFSAYALNREKKSKPESIHVLVKEPAPIPEPKILEFRITPTKLKVGQTFVVRYRLDPAVTKATLAPPGIVLDPKIHEIELTATRPGRIAYCLVVENAGGSTVERIVHVNVSEASQASIIVFKVNPAFVSYDRVQVVWQLSNAVRAEIRDGTQTIEVDPKSGSREILAEIPRNLTLVGYDSQGRTVEKQIYVQANGALGEES